MAARIHLIHLLFAVSLSLLGVVASAVTPPSIKNIVDLGYARYRGNLSYSDTVAYLGLPYAEPPLGELRFRAPVTLNTTRVREESSGDIVDASQFPETCVQGAPTAGVPGGAGSEDCLKVNVYAPSLARPGDDLPVLVYIHSGTYLSGDPAENPFGPWIHQMPHVIIVTMYYRLANLGFLAHPAFTADPSLADYNVGFLDQVESLRWVHNYIHRFGGDPERVTINGLSAGASAVELHMVSPMSEGLFTGAIAQSVFRAPLRDPEEQVPVFNIVAGAAGCANGTVAEQMSCMRSADITTVAAGSLAAAEYAEYNTFIPVFDGNIFPIRPTEAFNRGIFNNVNLMIGTTSNDTLAFVIDQRGQFIVDTNVTTSLLKFFPNLSTDDLDSIVSHYPVSDFGSAAEQLRVATGESQVRCAAEIMANAVSRTAHTAYLYRYNTPTPEFNTDTGCVDHGAEGWMMFNGVIDGINGTATFMSLNSTQQAFAEELIAYWLSFVRTGNPNTYKLSRAPEWPVYAPFSPDPAANVTVGGVYEGVETEYRTRLVLTQGPTESVSGSTVEVVPPIEIERCKFVASMAGPEEN